MADVFTKAKRSEVMSRIRGRGNKDTELRLIALFSRARHHGLARKRSAATVRRIARAGICVDLRKSAVSKVRGSFRGRD